jgi:hemoglobin
MIRPCLPPLRVRARAPRRVAARLSVAVAFAFALSLVACGSKQPPPPVEPKVEEVVTDAGPPEPVDAAPPPTLYDRLGGKEGVDTITDVFSKNLLADPRVSKYFKKNKDGLAHFKQMIAEQICQLAGGPCQYAGKEMKDAHHGMGIADSQFDAVVEDLKLALDEKGVSEQDKSELFAALAPMRADIVEKAEKKGKKK